MTYFMYNIPTIDMLGSVMCVVIEITYVLAIYTLRQTAIRCVIR